jgi:hypothetical protein
LCRKAHTRKEITAWFHYVRSLDNPRTRPLCTPLAWNSRRDSNLSCTGLSSQRRSNVTGRRPEGFTLPKRTSAKALPPSWPGYQVSKTAETESSHGVISTAPPAVIKRTTFLLIAAICRINSSCPGGTLLGSVVYI